jgi:hypothetical protein
MRQSVAIARLGVPPSGGRTAHTRHSEQKKSPIINPEPSGPVAASGCAWRSVAELRPSRAACGRQLSRPPGGSVRQWTFCRGVRTGPRRNHPQGRGCCTRSPVAPDRPEPVAQPPPSPGCSSHQPQPDRAEPVAQPPPAGYSCACPTHQRTSTNLLANRTPPRKQRLTATIFRPPGDG